MNAFTRIVRWLRPKSKSPEDIAAKLEAERLREEMKSNRLSARSDASQHYDSQGRRP